MTLKRSCPLTYPLSWYLLQNKITHRVSSRERSGTSELDSMFLWLQLIKPTGKKELMVIIVMIQQTKQIMVFSEDTDTSIMSIMYLPQNFPHYCSIERSSTGHQTQRSTSMQGSGYLCNMNFFICRW